MGTLSSEALAMASKAASERKVLWENENEKGMVLLLPHFATSHHFIATDCLVGQ